MTILVAEDHALLLQYTTLLFAGASPESTVLSARDGAEALALLQSHSVDLLLTDIQMPEVDGLALIEQAKRIAPHCVCAVLSAFEEFTYVQKAMRLGAVEYLVKSSMSLADIERLLTLVRQQHATSCATPYYADSHAPYAPLSHDPTLFDRLHYLLSVRATERALLLVQKLVQEAHTQKADPVALHKLVLALLQMMQTVLPAEHSATLSLDPIEQAQTAHALEHAIGEFCEKYRALPASSVLPPYLTKVLEYIHTHYARPLDLASMAKLAGFEKTYFSFLFQKEIGKPFSLYVEDVRLLEVQKRLRTTLLSMEEISEQTGFSSANYLAKVFRRRFGMSPSAFRAGEDG